MTNTQDLFPYFGQEKDSGIVLNAIGRLVRGVWTQIPLNFRNVSLDEYVVLPNGIHGIISFNGCTEDCPGNGDRERGAVLSDIVRWFKSYCVIQHAKGVRSGKWPYLPGGLWQRNYYEYIITSEKSLRVIRGCLSRDPGFWKQA